MKFQRDENLTYHRDYHTHLPLLLERFAVKPISALDKRFLNLEGGIGTMRAWQMIPGSRHPPEIANGIRNEKTVPCNDCTISQASQPLSSNYFTISETSFGTGKECTDIGDTKSKLSFDMILSGNSPSDAGSRGCERRHRKPRAQHIIRT